jgi:hypothetical protein
MLGCFVVAGLIVTIVYSIDWSSVFWEAPCSLPRWMLNQDSGDRHLTLAFEVQNDAIKQARREWISDLALQEPIVTDPRV